SLSSFNMDPTSSKFFESITEAGDDVEKLAAIEQQQLQKYKLAVITVAET
ncbi:unnamed protein product, partial [Rotaria socialis]